MDVQTFEVFSTKHARFLHVVMAQYRIDLPWVRCSSRFLSWSTTFLSSMQAKLRKVLCDRKLVLTKIALTKVKI